VVLDRLPQSDERARWIGHHGHPALVLDLHRFGRLYGGYINAFKNGHPVAGMMQNDPQWNIPDGWTTYSGPAVSNVQPNTLP